MKKVNKKIGALIFAFIFAALSLTACNGNPNTNNNVATEVSSETSTKESQKEKTTETKDATVAVSIENQTMSVFDSKMKTISFSGDCGFNDFLKQGGASSASDLAKFLSKNFVASISSLSVDGGCSTISTSDSNGNYIFGRNFDWYKCNAMVVTSTPTDGYKSVSTVNTDFIKLDGYSFNRLSNKTKALLCAYAPLDGMNEQGLAISMNTIEDTDRINQNTKKPDITPTTAVRLILDNASDVPEALKLLQKYDMHSENQMVHFAISDLFGRRVAVEYVDNEMVITDTKVLTNSFVCDGKYGTGTQQSMTRYNMLTNTLNSKNNMSKDDVKSALESVSQKNFDDGQTTEWTVVYNQTKGVAYYYHEENYNNNFTITLN